MATAVPFERACALAFGLRRNRQRCQPPIPVVDSTRRNAHELLLDRARDRAGFARTHLDPVDGPNGRELGGRAGPEPTRFGEWEKNGRCIDF